MRKNIAKYKMMLLIGLACAALAVTSFSACGGGGSGTTTEDGAETAGDDATEAEAGGPTDEELIADALAKLAINAALNIGLGLKTDDIPLSTADLVNCGAPAMPIPGGGSYTCDIVLGETAVNCPGDCVCGDDLCDASESPESCPDDCACGNGRCDEYGAVGEDSESCSADCSPVCGDGICSMEELFAVDEYFTDACIADCSFEYGTLFGIYGLMMLDGLPLQKCLATEPNQMGGFLGAGDMDDTSTISVGIRGVCGRGNRIDDVDRTGKGAIFIDFEVGVTELPVHGITFTCTEVTYDGRCMEGSAQLIFKTDGTLEFHTALAGKLYAYREDPPLAKAIVGAASSGIIALPPREPNRTCIAHMPLMSSCPPQYYYGDVTATYDVDDDGVLDQHVYYLEGDDSITSPDQEICQGFMVDWTLIAPDWIFGPPDLPAPVDEDGNGLAGCADPACADHPACTMTYCAEEGEAWGFNFHGGSDPGFCPLGP